MITGSTPPQQIVSELRGEEEKALFWFKKHYHGEKGYEAMRDRLIEKSRMFQKTVVSDVVEYISPHGNRWMAFETAQWYKEAMVSNSVPVAFCYYETYGSVGTFLLGCNVYNSDDEKFVLHFTNHFFLRFCERLGIAMRSRWMVQRFIEVIPGFMIGHSGKDEQGRMKIDVRLPGSIGRGILKTGYPLVEIRTYLTDKQLNSKQLRETERLREMYDKVTFEPMNVRMARMARSSDKIGMLVKEIENVAGMAGIDKEMLGREMSLRVMMTRAINDLGYVEAKDVQRWCDIGERTKNIDFFGFVSDYPEKGASIEKAKQLYGLVCEYGEKSGIKGYNAEKVMDKVLEIWKESISDGKEDKK